MTMYASLQRSPVVICAFRPITVRGVPLSNAFMIRTQF